MRKLIMPSLLVCFVAMMVSCMDETSDMPHISEMRDSIFKAYPSTVASITIKVEGKTNLKVILGGAELYKSPEDKRKEMANDLGKMAIRIFGKESHLKTGELVITKDERNSSEAHADGVSSGIKIDSLKKGQGI